MDCMDVVYAPGLFNRSNVARTGCHLSATMTIFLAFISFPADGGMLILVLFL